MKEQITKEVWAEVTYKDKKLYVFRIWKALLDDLSHNEPIGLRNYTNLIVSHFESWEKKGYKIYDHKKVIINPNNISYMDLHRFLAKDKEEITGPRHDLSDKKLQVLDVYIKTKYPHLAKTFKSDDDSTREFALINLQMFPRSEALTFSDDLKDKPQEGFYISSSDLSFESMWNLARKETAFIIPLLYFHEFGKKRYCVFHRAECPVKISHSLNADHELNEGDEVNFLIELLNAPIKLFSGILFESNIVTPKRDRDVLELDCSGILRERVFKANVSSNYRFNSSLARNISSDVEKRFTFLAEYHNLNCIDLYTYYYNKSDKIKKRHNSNDLNLNYLINTSNLDPIYDILNSLGDNM